MADPNAGHVPETDPAAVEAIRDELEEGERVLWAALTQRAVDSDGCPLAIAVPIAFGLYLLAQERFGEAAKAFSASQAESGVLPYSHHGDLYAAQRDFATANHVFEQGLKPSGLLGDDFAARMPLVTWTARSAPRMATCVCTPNVLFRHTTYLRISSLRR